MPSRLLTFEFSEPAWNSVFEYLEQDDVATLGDEIAHRIIDALKLRGIDDTLTHLGTTTIPANARTVVCNNIEIDDDNTTDFSHTDAVRLSLEEIGIRLEPHGIAVTFTEKPTPTEARQKRREERRRSGD